AAEVKEQGFIDRRRPVGKAAYACKCTHSMFSGFVIVCFPADPSLQSCWTLQTLTRGRTIGESGDALVFDSNSELAGGDGMALFVEKRRKKLARSADEGSNP